MLLTPSQQIEMTVEELAARVGAVPLWRIRSNPSPGTGTEQDVERVRREESLLCELIDGVLVEKAVSITTAYLAIWLSTRLNQFVLPQRLGWVVGPDGFMWLTQSQLRAPDVSFIARDQFPDHRLPATGYPSIAPALAVEIFSPGNTQREMEQKRRDFFAAGTQLFWIVYPDRQEVEVSTGPETHHTVDRNGTLDGGELLPGFSLKVAELFADMDLS